MVYFLFIIGFVFLIKGADWLVDGASSVAKKYGISIIVIGLTIVAFGTSMPELIVNLLASLRGSTEIAIGNVLGSNIANILLILGISAIIFPLAVKKNTTWKEIPLALLAVVAVALMANDMLIDGRLTSDLDRSDGLILLSFFLIFLYYIYGISKIGLEEQPHITLYSNLKSVLMIIGGVIALALGGNWIVDGAIAIANTFKVSQSLIGLTIVAIGTSLPELATSAVAAYKKNPDIAVGNIVGSNIFNVFWVLGFSAIIRPLPFSLDMNFDIAVSIIATMFLFLALFVGQKRIVDRWQGAGLVGLYCGYIIYLVWRG